MKKKCEYKSICDQSNYGKACPYEPPERWSCVIWRDWKEVERLEKVVEKERFEKRRRIEDFE